MAKPYLDCDSDTKEEFKEIVEFCREICHLEPIINYAFESYSANMQHAELIVRVPHLLTLYYKNSEKLKEIEENFSCLFKFYINKVIPAMTKALPDIKIKSANEMAEKDKKIWNLRKKFYFSIILTFIIATFVSFFSYDPVYEFKSLTIRNQIRVKDSSVNYKGVEARFRNIFGDNSSAWDKLTSDHIKMILEGKLLRFDDPHVHYLDELVVFDWLDLPHELKLKILNSKLIFQNSSVNYLDLLKSAPKSFESLTFGQISKILDGEILEIGKLTPETTNFYVERNFTFADIKPMFFRYNISDDDDSQEEKFDDFIDFCENFVKKSFDDRNEIIKEILTDTLYKSYLPRYDLYSDDFASVRKSSENIINYTEKEKIFILSADPGAGKTATFERLTVQIKNKFPIRWVSYIDLKDHIRLYKSIEDPKELLKEILNLSEENEFELKVFESLFSSGLAVLVWNGFDEIAPIHSDFIISIIQNIQKNTSNIQYICTRALCSEQLSKSFQAPIWQLIPFDEKSQKNFLTNFFISQNISKNLINKNIENVLNVMKKLIDAESSLHSFNTPLMLKLIAEIHENQTYVETTNLYNTYQRFIKKKIEIWMSRTESAKKTSEDFIVLSSRFSVIKMFQKYGLLNGMLTYLSSTYALKIKSLQIMSTKIPNEINYAEISRMGIVYINGENNFEFAHRTFVEFFIANFIIDNIYLAGDDARDDEVEKRLELFFLITKRYKIYQQIITDFMVTYLQSDKPSAPFSNTISRLLRTKFKMFLFNLLDTDYEEIFEFLIKFFKKDHQVLVSLLHVHDDETLYTAIFNPNFVATFINPETIKMLTKKVLTDEEFEIFIKGKNQKGKILYGVNFYNLTKFRFSSVDFWNYLYKINSTLSSEERKELFKTVISPKIYLFYDKLFSSADCLEYEKFWNYFEDFLTNSEMIQAIGYAIMQYIEVYPYAKKHKTFYLNFLLEKCKKFLSNSQIYEMFLDKNYFHEIHWDAPSFETLWHFLLNHTSRAERREILMKNDNDDRNFHFGFSFSDLRNNFTSYFHSYFYYDFTPFKIFHRALTVINAPTFNFTKNIYKNHFNLTEMQDMLMESNDALYYSIGILTRDKFRDFTSYLSQSFENNSTMLKIYLDKKIKSTNLTIFEYIGGLKDVSGSQVRWFENLQILQDLRDKFDP